jgi:hypothetical protein
MQVLGIFLVIYGAFVLLAFLLKFPFLYNNFKTRQMIKMMGKKGFDILVVVIGLASLIAGILILG